MVQGDKVQFWNSRSELGHEAGSNDFMLKRLEMDLLAKRVPRGARVLDVGCGNGETLVRLAVENGCSGVGVDFAAGMVKLASENAGAAGCGAVLAFQQGAVPGLPAGLGLFDCIITERCLINLDSAGTQHEAFRELMTHLKPGGRYFMIESFLQGLHKTNELRAGLQLEAITPPWHNIFLDETITRGWETPEFALEEQVPFSSTYHFLSRVVYARLARDKGEELRYDSDINALACKLPVVGDFGPVRLWVWRRA